MNMHKLVFRVICIFLSHDVAPVSDITPRNKIDKPRDLVVYRFIITHFDFRVNAKKCDISNNNSQF